jgi:CysZ protein
MAAVLRAALRGVRLLGDRRVLLLVLLPLLGAVALWTALAVAFWGEISGALARLVGRAAAFLGGAAADVLGTIAGNLVAFVALTLFTGALAVAALAVLAGPVFARAAEDRYFRGLERRRGGSLAGGVGNAATAIALWLAGWLLALPLLFVPVLNVLAPVLLGAWLNQRLFRYDALAEHAAREERRVIFRSARGRLYGLGLLLAPLAFVPVVNLVAPLHAGLAFTCLCLDELAALRARGARATTEKPERKATA